MRISVLPACTLLIGILVLFSGCKPKSAASAPSAPAEVEIARPVQHDEPVYAEWVGTLDGLVNAQVRAQVSGYLLKQHYAEGERVKAGDLLFEVDPRPFQIAVDQATAAAEKAEADYRRQAELAEQQVAARQEIDNATAARASARAALAQATLTSSSPKSAHPSRVSPVSRTHKSATWSDRAPASSPRFRP
jgi:multidrug efflux pump subunit AcrA (membrane-fusion protein)